MRSIRVFHSLLCLVHCVIQQKFSLWIQIEVNGCLKVKKRRVLLGEEIFLEKMLADYQSQLRPSPTQKYLGPVLLVGAIFKRGF